MSKLYVQGPPKCSGPWSECVKRTPSLTLAEFYRGQMRNWAGHWRRARMEAAIAGASEKEMASTALYFAKMYRDDSKRAGGAK